MISYLIIIVENLLYTFFSGSLLLKYLQENYFGEDDMYMDFEEAVSSPVLSLSTSSSSGWTGVGVDSDKKENESSTKSIHPLALRPWDITVLVNLYKVHGRLPVVSVQDKNDIGVYYVICLP